MAMLAKVEELRADVEGLGRRVESLLSMCGLEFLLFEAGDHAAAYESHGGRVVAVVAWSGELVWKCRPDDVTAAIVEMHAEHFLGVTEVLGRAA